MLHRVRQIDFRSLHPRFRQRPIQNFARRPNKRPPCPIFRISRLLADQHNARVARTFATFYPLERKIETPREYEFDSTAGNLGLRFRKGRLEVRRGDTVVGKSRRFSRYDDGELGLHVPIVEELFAPEDHAWLLMRVELVGRTGFYYPHGTEWTLVLLANAAK